jgi:hypothetical protein
MNKHSIITRMSLVHVCLSDSATLLADLAALLIMHCTLCGCHTVVTVIIGLLSDAVDSQCHCVGRTYCSQCQSR